MNNSDIGIALNAQPLRGEDASFDHLEKKEQNATFQSQA